MFGRKKDELELYLRRVLGCSISNLAIYKQVFVHRSVVGVDINGIKNSNERLEYLGDAILGAVVAEFLYKKYPLANEGFLSNMRSRLVSREHLNRLGKKIGLDKFAIVNEHQVPHSINGDIFEAFVGALFLDKGFEKTKKIIINRIFEHYVDIEAIAKEDKNYKGKLITFVQKHRQTLEYKTVKEFKLSEGKREYLVYLFIDNKFVSEGSASSIKAAQQNAAMIACEKLNL